MQSLPIEQKGHRFLELDALRGLAAFAVLMAHYNEAISQVPHPVFRLLVHTLGGHATVDLFFLLSGFVLTIPFLGRRPPSYMAYLLKRICRIYPPYAAAILIAAALAARLYSTIPTGNAWIDMTWSQPFSGRLLLQHLLLLGHFDNTRLNTAIWSLVVEMRMSLVFPFMVLIVKRVRARYLLALCVPGTLALALLKQQHRHEFILDTLFCSMLFLVGSMLSLHYKTIQTTCEKLQSNDLGWLFGAGFGLYQIGDLIHLDRHGMSEALSGYVEAWIVTAGAAAMIVAATIWTPLRHFLHNAVLRWLGARSFSIYLLHGTVLFTFIRLRQGLVLPLWMFLPFVVATLALAEAFHRSVELPTLILGRKVVGHRESSPTLVTQ